MESSCICELLPARSPEIRASRPFRPACSLWRCACSKVRMCQRLLPSLTGPSFADRPRSVARRLGWRRSGRLGTRSIGGGAAMEILDSGGSFAQLLKVALWSSSAYRFYPDLGAEGMAAMARVLTEASDSEGPGRQGPRGRGIP